MYSRTVPLRASAALMLVCPRRSCGHAARRVKDVARAVPAAEPVLPARPRPPRTPAARPPPGRLRAGVAQALARRGPDVRVVHAGGRYEGGGRLLRAAAYAATVAG